MVDECHYLETTTAQVCHGYIRVHVGTTTTHADESGPPKSYGYGRLQGNKQYFDDMYIYIVRVRTCMIVHYTYMYIYMCIDVFMCRIVESLSWGRVLQVACGGHHNLVLMESE